MVRRLLLLNALAVVGAVFHHAVVWVLTAMVWWTNRYVPGAKVPDYSAVGTVGFYTVRLVDQFAACAVPAFLCVSGYFAAMMLARAHGWNGWRAVLMRVKTLVPPYVLWSVFVLAIQLLQKQCTLERGVSAAQIDLSPGSVWAAVVVTGRAILTGSATPPFYYVPLLVQLLAAAPLVAPMARSRPRTLLALVALGLVLASTARSLAVMDMGLGMDYRTVRHVLKWPVLDYGFWFALGMVIASHLSAFKARLERWRKVLPWALAAAYVLSFVAWQAVRWFSGRTWVSGGTMLTDDVLALTLLFVFFAWDSMPTHEALNELGTMSYGVYLAHVPALEIGARMVYHFAPLVLSVPLLFGAILAVAGVAVPVLLMAFVDRLAVRRYYVYAFG